MSFDFHISINKRYFVISGVKTEEKFDIEEFPLGFMLIRC